MNTLKALAVGFFALASVTVASAAETIRITGSSAFRSATHTAIQNILQPGYTYAYSGSSLSSAGVAIFHGTTVDTNVVVTIKTNWQGSTGGLQAVAQNINAPGLWIADGVIGTTTGTSGTSGSVAQTGHVAMSDTFQATTQFNGGINDELVDQIVGVIPFTWVKGKHNNAGVIAKLANLTNVTPFTAQLAISGGVPLSFLTGLVADNSITVKTLGRDEDSGTRVAAYMESGFDLFGNPKQYQATISGGVVTALPVYPVNTVLGVTYPAGHSGYASGGTIRDIFNNNPLADAAGTNTSAMIAFLGKADANAVNGGANNLTFNGAAMSDDNIRNGRYTLWEYEHLMYRSDFSGNAQVVADQLAARITDFDAASGGILLSTMNVVRGAEGSIVSQP